MLRKSNIFALLAGLAFLAVSQGGTLVGAQTGHEGHGSMSHENLGNSSPGSGSGTAMPQGVVIRESKVQDATFVYRLYSWEERNVMMKGMEGHEMPGMDKSGQSTHHLMVFIKGADGRYLSGGKVGFSIAGADKSEFKTLTMGMFDGFGADVPLKGPGARTIRTKAVFGDKTLTEEFVYTMK